MSSIMHVLFGTLHSIICNLLEREFEHWTPLKCEVAWRTRADFFSAYLLPGKIIVKTKVCTGTKPDYESTARINIVMALEQGDVLCQSMLLVARVSQYMAAAEIRP